jgi:hypothetical protein
MVSHSSRQTWRMNLIGVKIGYILFVGGTEKPMKNRLLALGGLVLILALLALTGAGAIASQADAKKQVSYEGISFTYDASLATSVTAQTVSEQKQTQGVADWQTHPEHVKFEFRGFARSGFDPAIFIFPVRGKYVELDPGDPHATDPWLNRVVALQDILARKPVWSKPRWLSGSALYSPPFLPPINAATIFIGKQSYMGFRSGSAVRCLVQLTQQPNPIPSDEVLYSFQGLTSDGKSYLAARFPAFLTGPHPTPTGSSDPNWVDNYNQGLMQQIDQARSSDFFPDLDKLDQMMASVRISSSSLTPLPGAGAPRTGDASPVGGLAGLAALAGLILVIGGVVLRRTDRFG